ncbi:hypothetical protein FJ987_22295 [Mesorhizobium sp. CU2]|nr:hypothetical protein FJ988_20155 [Mesorhizobium sp. CU3]TPO09907.1 hypothetical protein FJ987_22295 [Mesorhizobium sp. CU2]
MAAKRPGEGCSRKSQRLTPLEHPSSVSALRADPPSPTRGEGKGPTSPPSQPIPASSAWPAGHAPTPRCRRPPPDA